MSTRVCVVTVDIHSGDEPSEVLIAHEELRRRGLQPTYFAPSALFDDEGMREALLRARGDGAEVGSHGHHHDAAEIESLRGNGPLAFLEHSAARFEEVFREQPRSFRSPCWCGLSARAWDRLAELGYLADSSATPQRLGLFSSSPAHNPWLLAPRRPRLVRASLLEIPTSSFVIPFGSLCLALLRRRGGLMFARALCLEAAIAARVVVIQLHVGDFLASGGPPRRRRALRDALAWRGHGWGLRHWTLDLDRARMNMRTLAVLDLLRDAGFASHTLSGARDVIVGSGP